ncbi:hypothetical protein C7974DRAFT_413144 [Boeremia exigua]|uniref:uncharacterized protein n=1 Tax=Boeremia exigua TaxID=749465 RepID=UPI001E8E4BDC|nr:uncharacterized protein C7974DRAFT_413144 [Boeremia exigua]KAH6629337.1 hypothetical protein C7974DRAFT_413144 [Boeremia exigua]
MPPRQLRHKKVVEDKKLDTMGYFYSIAAPPAAGSGQGPSRLFAAPGETVRSSSGLEEQATADRSSSISRQFAALGETTRISSGLKGQATVERPSSTSRMNSVLDNTTEPSSELGGQATAEHPSSPKANLKREASSPIKAQRPGRKLMMSASLARTESKFFATAKPVAESSAAGAASQSRLHLGSDDYGGSDLEDDLRAISVMEERTGKEKLPQRDQYEDVGHDQSDDFGYTADDDDAFMSLFDEDAGPSAVAAPVPAPALVSEPARARIPGPERSRARKGVGAPSGQDNHNWRGGRKAEGKKATVEDIVGNGPSGVHPPLEDVTLSYEPTSRLGKWMEVRNKAFTSLKRVVTPTFIDCSLFRLDEEWDEQPVLHGRNYEVASAGEHTPRRGSSLQLLSFTSHPGADPIVAVIDPKWLPKNTRENALRFGQAACKLFDRVPNSYPPSLLPLLADNWGLAMTRNSHIILARHICRRAFKTFLPDKKPSVQIVTRTINNQLYFQGRIQAIECVVKLTIRPNLLNMSVPAPDAPEDIDFEVKYPGKDSDADRPAWEHTAAVFKFAMTRAFCASACKLRSYSVSEFWADSIRPWRKSFRDKSKSSIGRTYNGDYVLTLGRHLNFTSLALTTTVKRDIVGKYIPTFYLSGVSKNRAAYVRESVTQAFNAGRGILNAIQHGLVICELLSSDMGFVPDSAALCTCTVVSGRFLVHFCQSCNWPVRCCELKQTPTGRRLCGLCVRTHGMFLEEQIDLNLGGLVAGDKMKSKASASSMTRDEIRAFISASFNREDMKADDAYVPNTTRGLEPGPFGASADAKFPYVRLNGKTALHTFDNVAVTALWINFCKNRFLPGILGVLSEAQSLRDRSREDPEWRNLMLRFDHQFGLIAAVPKNKSLRLDKAVSSVHHRLTKENWKSGRCPDRSVLSRSGQTFYGANQGSYDGPFVRTAEKIIREMENHYARSVPRSSSGAPWPFMSHHMPKIWSWGNVIALFKYRSYRMRFDCNSKHATIDTPLSLLLECIRQYLQYEGRDHIFGLEMTIWEHHPLCFAVAHDRHGEQMRSGFLNPSNIQSFAEEYDQGFCNIAFQPQVVNFAVHNFSQKHYARMVTELATIPWNCELYKRLDNPPALTIQLVTIEQSKKTLDEFGEVEAVSDSDIGEDDNGDDE